MEGISGADPAIEVAGATRPRSQQWIGTVLLDGTAYLVHEYCQAWYCVSRRRCVLRLATQGATGSYAAVVRRR